MIKTTCVKPAERLRTIETGVQDFKFNTNEYIKGWGLTLSAKPITFKGRLLPAPSLEYSDKGKAVTIKPKQPGVWDAKDKKLCRPATLGSWAVVSFAPPRRLTQEHIQSFIKSLIGACQTAGMNIKNPTPPICFGNPAGNVQDYLKEAWLKAGNTAKAKPELIVCIVPAVESGLYAEIKRTMNCSIGCASQVLVASKLTSPKGVGQYCGNVCLKLNAKLGGANVFLPSGFANFITEKP